MPQLIIVAVVGVAVLLAAIIIATSIQKVRTYRERQATLAASVGLSRVAAPDRELVERLQRLFKQDAGDDVSVTNVFKGDRLDHTLYMLDLTLKSGNDEEHAMACSIVAVRSPRLRLPRLTVRPKLNFKGAIGGALSKFVNGFVEARAPQDLTHVDLAAFGDIGAKYALFGADDAAVKAMLAGGLGEELRRSQWLSIEAEGDLLAISRLDLDASYANRLGKSGNPRSIFDDAKHLYEACLRS